MGFKSNIQGQHPWLNRSKQIGLASARKMMGFPLETFVRWLEMNYGPSTVNFNHVQEACHVGGVMRPIPGSEKVFLVITVRFLLQPAHDNIQQSISQKLWELGCRNTAPFAMRCSTEEDGCTTAKMSYLMRHIQVV